MIKYIHAPLAAIGLIFATNAMALDSAPVMSLEAAKAIGSGCEAKAKAEGWKMNIAVVDAGANLIYFQRTPGAFLGSVEIAIDKAKTSARFPFPTGAIANIVYGSEGKPGTVPGLAHVDGIIAFAGGLPVMAGKAHIGAVGVSGATAAQDEECAKAGIDAAAEMLK